MADTTKRLDRQEMERRVELLRELVDDADRRLRQYGQGNRSMHHALHAAKDAANVALNIACLELEKYREEWERAR